MDQTRTTTLSPQQQQQQQQVHRLHNSAPNSSRPRLLSPDESAGARRPFASPARRTTKHAWDTSLSRTTFFDRSEQRQHSFGRASRNDLDKILNGDAARKPGPIYQIPATMGRETPRFSMPRARRENSKRPRSETPAPNTYEIPSRVATETPSFSFGTEKRGALESDAIVDSGRVTPSPFSYYPSNLTTRHQPPAYSLSRKATDKNRFFSPLLYLSESVSPGPAAFSPSVDHPRPTSQLRTRFGTAKRPDLWPRSDTPAPGAYVPRLPGDTSHEVTIGKAQRQPMAKSITTDVPFYSTESELVRPKPQSYTIGKAGRDPTHLSVGRKPDIGTYHPNFDFVQSRAPATSMRFKEREYNSYGASPGKKTRFLSKQLAALENKGTHSPGAKYTLPTTFTGPKYSFAPPGREDEEEEAPRNDKNAAARGRLKGIADEDGKVRFNAVDRMYLGAGLNKNRTMGTDSPGFIYKPRDDVTRPHSTCAVISKESSKPPRKAEPPSRLYNPGLRALSTLRSESIGVRVGQIVNTKAGSRANAINRSLFGSAPGRDSPGVGKYSPQLKASSPSARIGGLQ